MGGQCLLVDAGLGVSRAVCDQGVALTEIDAIFVTHLHSDHYLERGPLLHTAWTAGLGRSVPVYGPPGLAAYWAAFLVSMAADIDLRVEDQGRRALADLVDLQVLDPSAALRIGDVCVTAMENDHPPVVPSFALRFESGTKSAVFSGDTAPLEAMADFAKGADLLVHEAMLTEGVDAVIATTPTGDARLKTHILRSHSPAEDVGRLATQAGVAQLALNHFVPDGLPAFGEAVWEAAVRRTWTGPLHLGRDGMVIAL